MSAEPDPEADYVGDAAEKRAILCVPCRQYRPLTRDGVPECEHTLAEAKDISDLTDLDWAYVRLHAHRQELDKDEPWGERHVHQSAVMSLVSDLVFADEEVPDPEDMAAVLDRRIDA